MKLIDQINSAAARFIVKHCPFPYWPDKIEETLASRPVASMLSRDDG